MDIQNLEYYIEVCKYMNITKASEKMHISQSSLSRRLATLEAELDSTLIDRSGGKFELTAAGQILLEEAEVIVKRQNKAISRLKRLKNIDAVRIGFSQNLYMRGFIDIVSEIKELFPDKLLNFREGSATKIIKEFTERQLDIIYTTRGEAEGLPGVGLYEVASNDLAVIVPKGHRLWGNSIVHMEDLAGEIICIPGHDISGEKTVKDLMSQFGIEGSGIQEIRCESPAETLVYACTCGYLGLTGLIGNAEKNYHPDKVRTVRIECSHMSYGDHVLAYHEDNPVAAKMVESLKE